MAYTLADLQIQPGGYAINPRTGQLELVYAQYDADNPSFGQQTFYFQSDTDRPATALSQAGYAPGYYADNGGGFLDGLGGLGSLALGTAGFGVGGVSGASAATGGGVTPQTLALDAAGLAAGYGLAGMGLGTPTAAAGGGAAAGGTAGGGGAAAAGGAAMPAAIPESAATLGSWGLTEVAPGVWAAGSGAAVPAMMPAAAPEVGAAASPSMPPAVAEVGATAAAPAASALPAFLTNPAVLGAGAGALLGSGVLGGGSEAGTVQTEEGLPDWLIPYARPALDRYTNELQNYQTDPYGIMPSAMKEFQNTISGMYLDPSTNKYLEDYFRLGSERIRTNLSPSFGHMQAFGQHSGYNEALARGLGDFATGLYGGNYAKERDRQTTMTASAPSFLGQASTQQFAPYQQYLSTIGNLGRKKEQPYFDNPMGNIIGGGMFGMGLGRAFS